MSKGHGLVPVALDSYTPKESVAADTSTSHDGRLALLRALNHRHRWIRAWSDRNRSRDALLLRGGRASVTIVTVHSAKGLDFPFVHLVDFHPVSPEGQSARAELYVAVTRCSSDLDLYVDLTDFPEKMTWLEAGRYDLDGASI